MKHFRVSTIPATLAIPLCAMLLCMCEKLPDPKQQPKPDTAAQPVSPALSATADLSRFKHVIVIYQENWSFDGLYSQFPGAHGYTFGKPVAQADATGHAIDSMNVPTNDKGIPFTGGTWKKRMPVIFYNLHSFNSGQVSYTDNIATADITHRFYHAQRQIDGGANNQFLYWSDSSAGKKNGKDNMNSLTMSGVDADTLPLGRLAAKYVMCDNCFQSAFGGSFLNHQWLISAQMPVYYGAKNDPKAAGLISKPQDSMPNKWDNVLSADPARENPNDYYAINTMQPSYPPQKGGAVLPPQTHKTIGDLLDAKGVSWKWYSQDWNNALKQAAGGKLIDPNSEFQTHHQPFNYYAKFDPSTDSGRQNRALHLADLEDFRADLKSNHVPAVSFVKFTNEYDEHPHDAALRSGDQMVAGLVDSILATPGVGDSCAIIITFDEFGGRWDHMAPPATKDGFGPGPRIPMIIISPFARRGAVDSTQYETVSILAFIENIWGLGSLSDRDRAANNLMNAFVAGDEKGTGN